MFDSIQEVRLLISLIPQYPNPDDFLNAVEDNIVIKLQPEKIEKFLYNLGINTYENQYINHSIKIFELALYFSNTEGDKMKCFFKLGILHSVLYNYQRAIYHYEQALQIAKEIGDKEEESACLNNLGEAYHKSSKYEKAISFYEQALQIAKEIGDKEGECKSYVNLGLASYNLSNYQTAISYCEQGLQIAKEIKDRKVESACYLNLGLANTNLSNHQNAISFYEQALQIKIEIGDKEEESTCYLNLGIVYFHLSNYQKAISFYEKALKLAKETKNIQVVYKCFLTLGGIHNTLSDDEKAISFYEQALKLAKEIGDKEGELACYLNIGHLYRLSNYQKAISFYEQALKLAKEIGDKEGELACYLAIGAAQHEFMYYQNAISFYEQALQIAKEIGDKEGESKCYINLGKVSYDLFHYQNAISFYEQGLQIAKEIGDKEGERQVYPKLSEVYFKIKKPEEAYNYLKESINLAELIGSALLEDEYKIGYYGLSINIYHAIVILAIQLNRKEQAFEYVERSKSKAFIDLMSKSNIKPTKINNPRMNEIYQKEQELLMKRNMIQNQNRITRNQELSQTISKVQTVQIPKSRSYSKKIEDIQDLNFIIDELNKIYDEMVGIDPEYVSLRRPQHLKLKQAQEVIKQYKTKDNTNSILVEYFLTSEKLYIFLVTKDNLYIEQIQELTSNNIQDYVDNYEKEVVNYPSIKNREKVTDNWLYGLSKNLIKPILRYLQQENVDLICFIPHGILHKLPLHALLLDTPQEQEKQSQISLIEKYKVVYSSSASLLQFHKSKRDQIQTCKAFAVALNYLEQEFVEEAMRVANLFGTEAKLDVTRQDVLHTQFTEDVLHFSCHGYFYPDDPLLSGLVLKNKEYLTARDILVNNLKIDSQLVTLSACGTGMSEIRKGDELIGLTRSFLYSGAQSLVLSLWNVHKQAALEIMTEFYNIMKNNEDNHDKASALQKAELTIKNRWKQMGRSYDHPYVWAPFVLVGDWR